MYTGTDDTCKHNNIQMCDETSVSLGVDRATNLLLLCCVGFQVGHGARRGGQQLRGRCAAGQYHVSTGPGHLLSIPLVTVQLEGAAQVPAVSKTSGFTSRCLLWHNTKSVSSVPTTVCGMTRSTTTGRLSLLCQDFYTQWSNSVASTLDQDTVSVQR